MHLVFFGKSGVTNDNITKKPDNRIYGEWIYERGHRIKRSGHMRVDDNGEVYVPD
jgi:hypothetical protein